MAITSNSYSGDGSTTNYSITFEYLKQDDVKATLDGTATTAFTFANATTLSFNSAPANGAAIRIFRDTDIDTLKATFFPGSAIKAEDLNDNFTQNNFASQETDNDVIDAKTTAASAVTTADSAVTTANSAVTTANSAVTTANSAVTTANSAVTTANTAATDATAAVNTANAASTTANAANATANAASQAVSNAGFYTPIADIASLPGSPANQDRVEIVNSTGVESSSAVSGVPTGFVGSTDLTVRLEYNSTSTKWEWKQYFASDPENRYAANYLPVIKGDGTTSGQVGKITLNCSNNTHGVSIQSPAHSASATYTLTLPANTGSANQLLTTDGSGALSWTSPVDITGKADLASPTFTGTPAAPTASQGTNTTQIATTAFVNGEIGQTIQGYDADTTKNDVANTFTATQTLNAGLTVDGSYNQAAEAVSALDIDLSTGNYFTKTISGNSTFTFSNPPSSGTVGSFTLELTHTSGTVTWPTSVKFNADTAPTLTTGKTHLFFFVTDDGGTRYRGAALVDYVN